MKKLLLVLSLLLPLSIMAEQRTIDEAQNVASNYLRTKAQHHLLGVSTQSPQLSLSMTGMSARSVAIYNTAGALVSRNAITQLPAGVYFVVADGKSFKVIVK